MRDIFLSVPKVPSTRFVFASFRLLGPARTRPSRSGARVDVAISSSPDVRRHSPSTEPLLRFFILRPFFRAAGSVSHLSVLGFAFVPRPAGAPSECAAVAFVPSPESSRRRFPLCFFVQRRRRPCSCLLSQPHRRACSCSAELGFVDLLFSPEAPPVSRFSCQALGLFTTAAAHFLSRERCSACSGPSGSKVLPRQEQGIAAGFGLRVRFVMC
jgi:hypothetical protein